MTREDGTENQEGAMTHAIAPAYVVAVHDVADGEEHADSGGSENVEGADDAGRGEVSAFAAVVVDAVRAGSEYRRD
jgi:hypothetical protein